MNSSRRDRSARSAEFNLVADCCRANFQAGNSSARPVLKARAVNWDRFLSLVRFHRVEGLAWKALSTEADVPPAVQRELHDSAMRIVARSLQAIAESRALLQSSEEQRIPLLFVKGLTLAALAYADPSLKASLDIDVLVAASDLERASRLISANGYRLTVPSGANEAALARWHQFAKESVWIKEPLQIDLHTRLSDNPRLLGGVDVRTQTQQVDVGGGVLLPTLAPDALFAYLAVHGACSAWFRLKWISDFAGLVASADAEQLTAFYRRSEEVGAGRAAGQALLLADTLFDTLAEAPQLRNQLASDRTIARLCRLAMKSLARAPREPTGHFLGTLPIHASQFLLLPGIAPKFAELADKSMRVLKTRVG